MMKNSNRFSFRRTAQALLLAMLVIAYLSACKDKDAEQEQGQEQVTDVAVTGITIEPYFFNHEKQK